MKNPKIAIIGLGYVGLPLAIEFSKKFKTIGFDNNKNRIMELRRGLDRTLEVEFNELQNSSILFTNELNKITKCDVFIVTVPTPVDGYNRPDLKPLLSASKSVGKILKKGDTVIYESTVFPGATEEFCVPILEKESGLKFNKDFFCGYSPERINPGDKKHKISSIIKITSGSNSLAAKFIDELYKSIITAGTYKVSSIRVAESAKVIENIQRDVNIALMNELAMIFDKLEIDTLEVLEAAGSKWNFLPFRPGLVGGHCIGVDPYYFTHKAQEIGYHPEMILAGRKINDEMGKYIAEKTLLLMHRNNLIVQKATVGIIGATFKENCPDLRNSKVFDIIENLQNYGCKLFLSDPYAKNEEVKQYLNIELIDLEKFPLCDALIVAVGHEEYKKINFNKLIKKDGILIDVKSIYDKSLFKKDKIKYWRL